MKKRLKKIFAGLLVLDLCVLGIVITKYYKESIPEELTWQGESLEEMELPPFCSVQTKRSVVDAMQTKTTSTNVPVLSLIHIYNPTVVSFTLTANIGDKEETLGPGDSYDLAACL